MEKIDLDLHEFLKKGKLNGIVIGMEKNKLLSMFHDSLVPSFTYDDSKGYNSEGYYLKNAEIIIYENKVSNIILGGRELKGFANGNNYYRLKNKMPLDGLIRILQKLGIQWVFSKDYIHEKSLAIMSEGGVYILIDYSEGSCIIDRIAI